MKVVGHYRLTSAALGDDCTLTRYVRNERATHKPKKFQPKMLGMGTPAFVDQGRTKFFSRVMRVNQMTSLLVSGHSNVKIGRDVRRGKLKGYWIYTLSLEERKTCPTSCKHWQNCFGNNMPLSKRVDHNDPEFLPRLQAEIAELCSRKFGVLIRLHALGDFYSHEYVMFWHDILKRHPNLSLYGYTARKLSGTIGAGIHAMNLCWGERCMIRLSNGARPTMSTVSITNEASRPQNAFICPEQSGKTQCCATCGLCWATSKNVAFLEH